MNKLVHKTRNSLPSKTRQASVGLLNQQLADILDLGLQAKHAHWNVKGPNFIGLHELFDKVAEELEELTDEIAERAVELGGFAQGTIQAISKNSRISAYPLDLARGKEHLEAIANALSNYGTRARDAIDTAGALPDADTADLFTQVSRSVDKLLWMVEAHTQSED